MKKILGIDVGVTSVGWGIIDENNNIVDAGVRLFDEVENRYKNSERREKRGQRRVIRRRRQRIIDLKSLLVRNNIIDKTFKPLENPYELRIKGLKNQLTNEELATILLFYAKRRGSSLEVVDEEVGSNEEGTKQLLAKNKEELKKHDYIVYAQMERLKEDGEIRNSLNVYRTEDYVKEINAIFKNQNISNELQKQIINLITRRRHFSEGPGNYNSPSPYGRYREIEGEELTQCLNYINKHYKDKYKKETITFELNDKEYKALKNGKIINAKKLNLIELMRGKCSIYSNELRAPKQSFSAELFNLLNDLNNLKINNRENPKITKEEKEEIISLLRKRGNVTVNQVLKILNADLVDISGFRLNTKEKPILTEFVGYKKIMKVIKDLKKEMLEDKLIDKIFEVLTKTQVEVERFEEIYELTNDKELSKELSLIPRVSGYHNLSFKAIYYLNEEMINESKNQQQIITEKNLKESRKLEKLTLDDTLILSPVAKRAHRESLKLIEQLIKEHGNFQTIVIETTRDKNTREIRKRISDAQRRNKKMKEDAEEIIGDYSKENVNRSNIFKLTLYNEQNGKCAYTGLPIDLSKLIRDPRAYEVDHIIPLSVSYDDSRNNKVLVLPRVNHLKGNKTPFGYFMSGNTLSNSAINTWEDYESYVLSNNNYSNFKKRNLLFKKDITKYDVMAEFANRNIVDTSYAARSLMTTLRTYFKYNEINTVVRTIRGKQTNLFRRMGIQQYFRNNPNAEYNPLIKDRDHYIHHAQDALIIAGLSNRKSISNLYKLTTENEHDIHDERTGEINPTIKDENIMMFLKKISELRDEDIKYSWKIDTKPNRSLADETTYSTRIVEGDHMVVKTYNNIYELTSSELKKIFSEKNRNKLLVYKHDRKTFDILFNAYEQYKHESKPLLTFKENHGFVKKYSKNNNGPIVKNLKYVDHKLISHLDITPHDAKDKKVVKLQLSPYRTDIFYNKKDKMYKFVTVRYNDMLEKDNKYVIDDKWYKNQMKNKGITNEYEFMFSLYRNNMIRLTRNFKGEVITEDFKFIATNNDKTNQIEVKPINKYESKQLMPTIGITTINLDKFNVSITGKMQKVKQEVLKLVI